RRPLRDLALGEAYRDHAIKLVWIDETVAVVIVDAESEHQLFAVASEDEPAHTRDELVFSDYAIAVLIEARENAPRQVLAAETERCLELRDVDARVRSGVAGEGPLERLDEARVDEGGA